jgi:hypothetical protein
LSRASSRIAASAKASMVMGSSGLGLRNEPTSFAAD